MVSKEAVREAFREAAKKEKKVNVGESFTITLIGTLSSGYQWEPVFDRDFLRLDRKEVKLRALTSSSANYFFTFTGLKEGKTNLDFVFQKPEVKASATEKRTFEVDINPKASSSSEFPAPL